MAYTRDRRPQAVRNLFSYESRVEEVWGNFALHHIRNVTLNGSAGTVGSGVAEKVLSKYTNAIAVSKEYEPEEDIALHNHDDRLYDEITYDSLTKDGSLLE